MYSREVNREVLEFGTSGMLYRSNKLMYDRGTDTLWSQFLGEPAVGLLADTGIKLELLPVLVTTWGDWVAAHPDTTVPAVETGVYPAGFYRREEDSRSAYFQYRNNEDAIFPAAQRDDRLPAKSQVLGLMLDGHAKACSLDILINESVINDSLGEQDLVVVTADEDGEPRPYDRGAYSFSLAESGEERNGLAVLVYQQSRRWLAQEDALVPLDGSSDSLRRLPSHMAYWFGWYSFYPDTAVY